VLATPPQVCREPYINRPFVERTREAFYIPVQRQVETLKTINEALSGETSIYKVGSLFAGVGGICQGFMDASCSVVWANENDEYSCKTYKLNHKNTTLIERDVKKLLSDDLDKIDILTAGFPCQPFSVAGHGKGFDDPRGELFYEAARLLKELQPAAYFLENVKTIVNHDGGKSFGIVMDEIRKAGYSFIPFILNASDYSEIPQGRERIYMVGFRNEPQFFYPKPTKINSGLYSKDDEMKTPLSASFTIPSKVEKLKSVKEFLDHSTVQPGDYYNNPENRIYREVRNEATSEDTVYHYRRWYVRENKKNLCPTLCSNMGVGGHNIPIILDGAVPRRLTPKECFNLQGLPRDFKLPVDVSDTQMSKQLNN